MDCLDQRIKENSRKAKKYVGRSSAYIKPLKRTPDKNSHAQAYFSRAQTKTRNALKLKAKGHALERTWTCAQVHDIRLRHKFRVLSRNIFLICLNLPI